MEKVIDDFQEMSVSEVRRLLRQEMKYKAELKLARAQLYRLNLEKGMKHFEALNDMRLRLTDEERRSELAQIEVRVLSFMLRMPAEQEGESDE